MTLPSLVLVDDDPRSRLSALDALRCRFSVEPVPEGEAPLRTVRRQRPAAVVVALRSMRVAPVVHLCERLRTEPGITPRIVVWNATCVAELRRLCETRDLADAYLEGEVGMGELIEACAAVLRGERPRVEGDRPASRLAAWWRALRRS